MINPPPVVDVWLQRAERSQYFIIEECPFCGRRHAHGAGRENDDPHGFEGHRWAHCRRAPCNNPGYILRWTGEFREP